MRNESHAQKFEFPLYVWHRLHFHHYIMSWEDNIVKYVVWLVGIELPCMS